MNNEPPYQDLPSGTPPPPPGTGYTHYPAGQSSQGYAPQSGYGTPPGYSQPGPGYRIPEYAQPGGAGYVPPLGYAQPVYPAGAYAPPIPDPGRGMAITGFVLGIVGLCLLCLTVYGAVINLIVSGLGIVFSAIGRKSRTGHGLAVAGLVMSIIAMVISFLFFLALIGILALISVPHSGY